MGILNYEEEYLGEFGYGFGDGEGQFKLPVAMCFDSKDRLYVTDELNNRITVFNSSGMEVAVIVKCNMMVLTPS